MLIIECRFLENLKVKLGTDYSTFVLLDSSLNCCCGYSWFIDINQTTSFLVIVRKCVIKMPQLVSMYHIWSLNYKHVIEYHTVI